jgi:hypothetical protein
MAKGAGKVHCQSKKGRDSRPERPRNGRKTAEKRQKMAKEWRKFAIFIIGANYYPAKVSLTGQGGGMAQNADDLGIIARGTEGCVMGGAGSGNHYHWWRGSKKRVVEHCRHLDANRWMREKILAAGIHQSGGWNWYTASTGERTSAIGYEVCTLDMAAPWLWLSYTFTATGDAVDYVIELTTTQPRFGGLRWWFLCPLPRRGGPCSRRVGKLYLPPQARYYGCRHCYNLTYTSCQESRKYDSLFRFMARNTAWDVATVKQVMNAIGKRSSGLI